MKSPSKVSRQDLSNTGLLQDEVLLTIVRGLDEGLPIGPSFVHSLATLIESLVVHDKVFYDLRTVARGAPEDSSRTIEDVLENSSFVKALVKHRVLAPFPSAEDTEELLSELGVDYTYGDFLTDLLWTPYSFYADPSAESARYRMMLDLVAKAPQLLRPRQIIPILDGAEREKHTAAGLIGEEELESPIRFDLGRNVGLSPRELLFLEGLNFRSRAYMNIARILGMHMYPAFPALPHQIGAIQNGNIKGRQIYDKVMQQLRKEAEIEDCITASEPDFWRISLPPVAQMALKNCKGSVQALVPEILEIRQRDRTFRNYLTTYERTWNAANTRQERNQLAHDFNNAWKVMLAKERKPSTRILYILWDYFKDPTKLLQTIGDKLAGAGRERYIIDRAYGLYDFWRDLCDTPPPDSNRALVFKLFPNQVDEATWNAAQQLAGALNATLGSPPEQH